MNTILKEQNRFSFSAGEKYLHSTTIYQKLPATAVSTPEIRRIRTLENRATRKIVCILGTRQTVPTGPLYKLDGSRAGSTLQTGGRSIAHGMYIQRMRKNTR